MSTPVKEPKKRGKRIKHGTKKSKKRIVTKDPSEATRYLTSWKAQDDWKFNKNTQSWLIRHMYDPQMVPKHTFAVLLEYLSGLKGDNLRQRIQADATRRALRYQQYNKESKEEERKEESNEESKDAPKSILKKKSNEEDVGGTQEGDDETRWKQLSDHDKRKEYKRAIKILEMMKQS